MSAAPAGVLERAPGALRRALAQVGGEVAAVVCCALLAGCAAAGNVEPDGTATIDLDGIMAPELHELLTRAGFQRVTATRLAWRGIPF